MGFWKDIFGSPREQGYEMSSGKTDPLSGFSEDEIQLAALRVMKERPESRDSWIGGTVEQADRAIVECNRLREKYADYEPPRMRRAIMDWISFFEKKATENRKDCETQKSKRELDDYRERSAKEQKRTAELLDRLHNSM